MINTAFEEKQKKVLCEYLNRKAKLYAIAVEENAQDLRLVLRPQINLLLELACDLELYTQAEANDFRLTLRNLYNF